MEPNIFTIVFMGCILGATLMLQGISSISLRDKSSNMGAMPLILGIIGAVLMIILFKNDPFTGIYDNLEMMEDKDKIKTWGIAYGLFLVVILAFFMKLNNTDKKYSLSSETGIFGVICGLSVLLSMYLIDNNIVDKEDETCNYLFEMAKLCYILHKFVLLAAVALLCGAIFNINKAIRYACLFIVAGYFISSNYFIAGTTYIFGGSGALDWEEFNENITSTWESMKFLRYTPFVGWIILMVTFYLKYEKKESNN